MYILKPISIYKHFWQCELIKQNMGVIKNEVSLKSFFKKIIILFRGIGKEKDVKFVVVVVVENRFFSHVIYPDCSFPSLPSSPPTFPSGSTPFLSLLIKQQWQQPNMTKWNVIRWSKKTIILKLHTAVQQEEFQKHPQKASQVCLSPHAFPLPTPTTPDPPSLVSTYPNLPVKFWDSSASLSYVNFILPGFSPLCWMQARV